MLPCPAAVVKWGQGGGRAGKITRRVRNGEAESGDKMRLERKGLHPPCGPVGGGKRKDDTACCHI